ncbi:MAG: hypothetical protein ACRDZ4_21390 [Egibacteraceae bacterium]
MIRERWDEMRLQEKSEEEAPMEDGRSSGEGVEKRRRPIGFGYEYRSRLSEGVK